MELVTPSKRYYASYMDAINEYREHNTETYPFLGMTQCGDLFQYMEDSRLGRNLPEGYVNATYLWLVNEDEFVGEVSIRHSLTEALLRYGGNIGYGVKLSQWNKGVGTMLLSKALPYAKEKIGLEKVLITCDDTNIGSARVIEKKWRCIAGQNYKCN